MTTERILMVLTVVEITDHHTDGDGALVTDRKYELRDHNGWDSAHLGRGVTIGKALQDFAQNLGAPKG